MQKYLLISTNTEIDVSDYWTDVFNESDTHF